METKFKVMKAFKIIGAIIFFVLLFGTVTMMLWNWLVPLLFKGPVIGFCQAIGLLVLSKILFGGFHGKGGRCGRGRYGMREHWKRKMEERMSTMTEEEKEKFRNRCSY